MLQHFVTFREWQIRRCNAAPAIAINRDKEKGDFCSRMLLLQPPKSVCHHLALAAIIAVLVRVRVSIVIMQVWQDLVGKDEVADHDVGENRFRPGCDPQ
jgi:hypothetical protein